MSSQALGNSYMSQLLAILHNIDKNLNNMPSHDTRGISLDISKAFDKVWHEGLIFKLKMYGIRGKLLSIFYAFLSRDDDNPNRVN